MKQSEILTSRILVVDDNLVDIEVVITYLKGTGLDVTVANSGREALEIVEQIVPDLILMDVMMPGMNGFESCRRLKAEKKFNEIPIIFMTSLGDMSNILAGFDAGGVDYITKPLRNAEVLARIKTHLTVQIQRKKLVEQNEKLREYQDHLEDLVSERTKDLQESEERFRVIIQNSNAGYLYLDLEGYARHVNKSWLTMHGYSHPDQVLGSHFSELGLDSNVSNVQVVFDTMIKGEYRSSGDFSYKTKKGDTQFQTYSLNQVFKRTKLIGIEGFFIDVTSQKTAQKKEMENMSLSHELRIQEKQLQYNALKLTVKNNLIDNIKNHVKNIQKEISANLKKQTELIIDQIGQHNSHQQDWESFEVDFDRLYHDFTKRLASRYPKLKPREIRICMLLRMNMSTQEMSDILFISPRSIDQYRYRIRKTLGLSSKQNLISFLSSI